ncbi:MAG: class I SAM-dependent methyltransferase [Proteobacteria bacterium]|nr:class I SAM-dependent methyltransferase [Pseudomonadota bacterium]
MSRETLNLTPALYEYLQSVSVREDPVLARLREETGAMPQANMQIGPEQGQFMALLAKLIGAKRCIEVGVFTGYSSLCVARAIPPEGRLIACDVSEEFTRIAKRYWEQAGVADRIDLRIGPAKATLEAMLKDGNKSVCDFAFIDADKTSYRDYYELCLELMRPGGLIAIDNTLWGGAVADPQNNEKDTQALRDLNAFLHDDDRVDISLVPIGDGLTLARKRD